METVVAGAGGCDLSLVLTLAGRGGAGPGGGVCVLCGGRRA